MSLVGIDADNDVCAMITQFRRHAQAPSGWDEGISRPMKKHERGQITDDLGMSGVCQRAGEKKIGFVFQKRLGMDECPREPGGTAPVEFAFPEKSRGLFR